MPRPLRIVKLCAQHNPFDGRVFHLEAKALRDAGHRVSIVAPNPGDLPARSERDGITIRLYEKRYSGARRKAWTLWSLMKEALAEPADVFHVHEGDAALAAAAWAKRRLAKRGRTVKLVYDVHEVWPWFYAASTSRRWLKHLAMHGFMAWERYMLTRHVDAVSTAHALEMNYYRWLNPFISVRHVLTAPNLDPPPPKRSGPIRVLGHEGYFTLNRGMDLILEAFALVAADHPELTLQTAGDFHGDKDRIWFEEWAGRTGLGHRVQLSGWVNRPELNRYLDGMDIGLIAQRVDDHQSRVWPLNKLMNYHARGLPVIMTAKMPHARMEIEEAGYGRVIDYDVRQLAAAISAMVRDPEQTRAMGRRGREHALRHYEWDVYRAELLRLYDDLRRPTARVQTVKLQG